MTIAQLDAMARGERERERRQAPERALSMAEWAELVTAQPEEGAR